MAIVNDVPQLVEKNRGSYTTIAHKLEPGKFSKWKKRMLCYLARMEPYYLKCIKDSSFQPKTAQGDANPESQWTPDERKVVVQDQHLKSLIIFEGPSDTKENRIMDLKLEYQTFRAKSTESLPQTYTRYKTLLNEIANDGVNLSKHEINVGFINSLPEKWLTFSQGLRNVNHTQTLDLADIYGRFVYEDNQIQRRISKKILKMKLMKDLARTDLKFQKAYKAEYKKMKAKLPLFEASPSSSQNPKTFQPKNKRLVAETFNWDEEEVSDDKKSLSQCISEQIPHQKKKVLGGELFTESSSKKNENENIFLPAAMGYDQEMVPKDKDWVERLSPDSKLLNFNTRRILVPESQAVDESLESTETSNAHELSKDSEAESLTPLPPLKNLQ
ncbi:hypothetical protein Tco_1464869 [Tanacetum coccineum]